jgi:hypothetical protein
MGQENVETRGRIDELLRKVDTLEKDNVKLYEKMQYVQSYRRQNAETKVSL